MIPSEYTVIALTVVNRKKNLQTARDRETQTYRHTETERDRNMERQGETERDRGRAIGRDRDRDKDRDRDEQQTEIFEQDEILVQDIHVKLHYWNYWIMILVVYMLELS